MRASELTFPSACTAVSRTSLVSQRSKGTINLYNETGEIFPDGALLSFLSVVRLSGDELIKGKKLQKY